MARLLGPGRKRLRNIEDREYRLEGTVQRKATRRYLLATLKPVVGVPRLKLGTSTSRRMRATKLRTRPKRLSLRLCKSPVGWKKPGIRWWIAYIGDRNCLNPLTSKTFQLGTFSKSDLSKDHLAGRTVERGAEDFGEHITHR